MTSTKLAPPLQEVVTILGWWSRWERESAVNTAPLHFLPFHSTSAIVLWSFFIPRKQIWNSGYYCHYSTWKGRGGHWRGNKSALRPGGRICLQISLAGLPVCCVKAREGATADPYCPRPNKRFRLATVVYSFLLLTDGSGDLCSTSSCCHQYSNRLH